MSEFLSVDSFASFDLETTGLDSEKDEIIEIGMVRIKNGKIAEQYQSLFKPSISIPPHITKLTGIRDQDCANRPPLSQKLPEILDFLNGCWIIAHHADFDYGFLSRSVQQFLPNSSGLSYSKMIDTLDLCRILLPFLPNHRLETVVGVLEISFKPHHRALQDAEATALLFDKLIPLVLELDIETVKTVNRILNGASDGLRLFFQKIAAIKTKERARSLTPKRTGPQNVMGQRKAVAKTESVQRISDQDVCGFFGPEVILTRLLSRYEPRKPQVDMAKWIVRAFNEDAFLVAEAGTGVGKSLAYLVPTLFWLTRNPGQKAVISTHTKTLQDQLFFKDIPLLEKHMPDAFSAVLLKGRSNYLCLSRWNNLIQHLDERLTAEQKRKLLPLVFWISQTRTGDVEENTGFFRELNGDVWAQLNCETRHCRNRECNFEPECFLQKIRKATRSADLVVVNHSLLFSTLNGFNSVLGEYDTLIVDEAHQIEKIASQYLGITLNARLFNEMAYGLYQAKPLETGILVFLSGLIKNAGINRDSRMKAGQTLHRLKSLSIEIHRSASDLFQALDRNFLKSNDEKPDRMKMRIRKPEELMNAASVEMTRLKEVVAQTRKELTSFLALLEEATFVGENVHLDILRELESSLERLSVLQESLEHFHGIDCTDNAVWCECRGMQSKREVSLCSVPVDVGGLLARKLYPRMKRGIFTSATLTVGEHFDYVLNRWGLKQVEPERLLTRTFGSPFDFREQALFLIPNFLSNPKEAPFAKEVASLLSRLLTEHPKGTLVLFTSHSMLREVYQSVQPILEEKDIRMLGQGIDGSRTSVLRMFQQDTQSVLFGTTSFWEGVDVPGEALEMLVITKIPFDVPTEPVFEARMERIQKQNGNAFFNYAIPEAIVRFRQGFGRLIRSCEDRGVILMLDHRVVQTAYGSLFLNALPVEAKLCQDEATLFFHLDKWFSS